MRFHRGLGRVPPRHRAIMAGGRNRMTAVPRKDPTAKRFDRLTFAEALERQLGVMDLTALAMCMENHLPVIVFDFKAHGNIRRVVAGENIGTLVTTSENSRRLGG